MSNDMCLGGGSSSSDDDGADDGTYYAVLGLTRDASSEDIRRAYLRAAITRHPDKGGDPEAFKELAHAYYVLADHARRALYDEGGVKVKEGVPESTGRTMSSSPDSTAEKKSQGMDGAGASGGGGEGWLAGAGAAACDHVFYNASRDEYLRTLLTQKRCFGQRPAAAGLPRRPTPGMHPLHAISLQEELDKNGVTRRGQDITGMFDVSLQELYNGVTKRLSLYRNAVCSNCNGEGITTRPPARCATCYGKGEAAVYCQVGPSMRPVAQPCPACGGAGVYYDPDVWDRCSACGGRRVVPERRVLEIDVGRGTRDGDRFTFAGLADEAPGCVAGDVVVVVVVPRF